MKLSHSACQKYLACPRMYKLHYIDKLRPNYSSSALLFGDAIDKAINELLLKTGNDPYEVFIKHWTQAQINKVDTFLPTATNIIYANKDFDASLLTQEDYAEVDRRVKSGEVKTFVYEDLAKKKKNMSWDKMSEDEKKYYNLMNWLVMKNKAKYFIDAYEKQVIPKIKKVHKIQHPISISNGEDEVTGFIDIVAEIEDYEGLVIIDNKTSSREYDWDAVQKSPQLALYQYAAEEFNSQYAGFVVMIKNLEKNKVKICTKCGNDGSKSRAKTCDAEVGTTRCHGEWKETTKPEAKIQIIINKIDTQFKELVIENFDEVTKAVKAEVFPMNLERCYDHFGGSCDYVKYCRSNKCMVGLSKKEE